MVIGEWISPNVTKWSVPVVLCEWFCCKYKNFNALFSTVRKNKKTDQMCSIWNCRLSPCGLLFTCYVMCSAAMGMKCNVRRDLRPNSWIQVPAPVSHPNRDRGYRQTESSRGRHVLSKDRVQCTGDVVFMVVDGLFPQSDLHVGVTLKTQSDNSFFSPIPFFWLHFHFTIPSCN